MTFEDFCDEYKIPMAPEGHAHTTEGWIQIDCPFCSANSQHWRMGFNKQGKFCNCWSCGGRSLSLVIEHLADMEYKEARKLAISIAKDAKTLPNRRTKVKGILTTPKGLQPLREAHRRYLQSRGFVPDSLVRLWSIQGIGISGHMSWRIFIPVIWKGQTVSFLTRAISDKVEQRYLSASPQQEAFPHKNLLYGIDYVREAVIINEGPTDVWRIGPGAVATMGTSYTQEQINLIVNVKRRYVCFDNEPTAQKRAQQLIKSLAAFPGRTYNIELDAKDPEKESLKNVRRLQALLRS